MSDGNVQSIKPQKQKTFKKKRMRLKHKVKDENRSPNITCSSDLIGNDKKSTVDQAISGVRLM